MRTSSLQNKTIRPGSLSGYSYYHSNRQPQSASSAPKKSGNRSYRKFVALVAIVIVGLPIMVHAMNSPKPPVKENAAAVTTVDDKDKASTDTKAKAVAKPAPINYCDGNAEAKMVKIDLSERKMWACEAANPVYEAPIISGMAGHEETITPVGNYEIYGHQEGARLTGSDSAGSWDRQVDYWMPFLHNEHGIYGFHDAQWRPDSEYGTIDPNSDKGSHGCIELPKAAMGWLYVWSTVGTPVIIQD